MGAVEAEHEIHILRVSVQETLYRDLRAVRERCADAEAALAEAIDGRLEAAVAHLDRHDYARRVAHAEQQRERRRQGPRGMRGFTYE
jgi:hypothetical protein